ncbi:SPOR domain-containing protein [Magnetofaba australis]|uniref:SPOR domain-containing protein n=1 Tax=Magnetofaba australis TaxID=1472297 RepID=UPI001301AD90|nr:SPOR domain-containing protein [Magnetofaba australis]
MAILLGVGNAWVVWDGLQSMPDEETEVWTGEPRENKVMLLPERVLAVLEPKQEAPAQEVAPAPKQMAEPVATPEDQPQPAVVEGPDPEEPILRPKAAQEPVIKSAPPPATQGLIVQAGSYALKFGADRLVKRLQEAGLEPFVAATTEMVRVNEVQAGPFDGLAPAKEAEIKLRAGGLPGHVEETHEGFILTITQSPFLGQAIQVMEQAEGLSVRPVRLVKKQNPAIMHKVLLGPVADRKAADDLSARLTDLGVATPVIKRWDGDNGEISQPWKKKE